MFLKTLGFGSTIFGFKFYDERELQKTRHIHKRHTQAARPFSCYQTQALPSPDDLFFPHFWTIDGSFYSSDSSFIMGACWCISVRGILGKGWAGECPGKEWNKTNHTTEQVNKWGIQGGILIIQLRIHDFAVSS